MNSRWANVFASFLIAFAGLVLVWQLTHYHGSQNEPRFSLAQSFMRGQQMAGIAEIVQRDRYVTTISGDCRLVDLMLPQDARLFMVEMTGPANRGKLGYFYYLTYYLFPREVGTSLDHRTRLTKDGLVGPTSESEQEILTNGFNVIDSGITSESGGTVRSFGNIVPNTPVTPEWFDSNDDWVVAFLLPLLTAFAGMWLFRCLFPSMEAQMPVLEQLACGLGLGMMAVAALTLGIKLCGWHGFHLVFLTTAGGAIAEICRNYRVYGAGIDGCCRQFLLRPMVAALFVAATLVFLVLFRLAGLQGVTEFDAVMAWLLKAKIIHLCAGGEIVQWFSNPGLAHAHLDYPTLVPSLHAATYDSIGHVNEFVTKFWPTWMLFFLLASLASVYGRGKGRFHAAYFALLGLLLLPAIQKFVQMEGGTLPMIFFTVMGFVQCALWLTGKDRARLGLGLTFLFGAAMAKFEGLIFLTLVVGWMLLVPPARPGWRLRSGFWRVAAFWFFAALPFVWLRCQIPVLHFESGWAGYALHHPAVTLSNVPWIFMILFARLFLNSDFAIWNDEGERWHWTGRWDGLESFYNPSTLGLAWFCVLLTVTLWLAQPVRRPVIIWMLVMLFGALVAFSVVFASFVNTTSLNVVIGYTADDVAGRYLLPILLAWFATLLTLFFGDLPPTAPTTTTLPKLPRPPVSASRAGIAARSS